MIPVRPHLDGIHEYAIIHLQQCLKNATSLFWDQVLSAAVDKIIRNIGKTTTPAPTNSDEIAKAGKWLVCAAICDAKKTVRSRLAKMELGIKVLEDMARFDPAIDQALLHLDAESLLTLVHGRDRQVLKLRLDDLSDQEIAQILNIQPQTVPVLACRALKKLRRRMATSMALSKQRKLRK